MKSGAFFMGHVAIGILLILVGLSIIIKIVFDIDIPIFKTLLAGFLIYLGVSMLLGNRSSGYKQYVYSGVSSQENENTYSLFGCSRVIDLRHIKASDLPADITINAAFSKVIIKVDPYTPMEIKINAGFSNATLPNGNTISFGTYHYKSEGTPVIRIHAHVAFSSFEID